MRINVEGGGRGGQGAALRRAGGGAEAVDGVANIHDWHATILHLLGLDHERLTYPYAGRDFRLTEVYGNVLPVIA